MLGRIWTAFFVIAMLAASVRAVFGGDAAVFGRMVDALFDAAKTGFEISLGLTGVMALWLGFMRLGEKGGAVDAVARLFAPLLRRLFPSIPAGHPAAGSIVMNMAANALGLDNAATPLGLKAMRELQELNPDPDTASDDQILFLVLNTSSVTLLPVTIFTYRAQLGAAHPTDVFVPILIATFCSTMAGLLVTAAAQRRPLWRDPVVLSWLGGLTALVAGVVAWAASLDQAALQARSSLVASLALLLVITAFIATAARRRVPVYETFVEGARDGFGVAVSIIPYLVGMLAAIAVLRASGALDLALDAVRAGTAAVGLDGRWVDGLPTALMKPLSGSGARGMMVEAMRTFGADSFVGRLVSVMQGSTETTFYVLAVYFGSVGIRRTRHAAACGLAADAAGLVAAVLVSYLFFG